MGYCPKTQGLIRDIFPKVTVGTRPRNINWVREVENCLGMTETHTFFKGMHIYL
jgi:hypothetical protein